MYVYMTQTQNNLVPELNRLIAFFATKDDRFALWNDTLELPLDVGYRFAEWLISDPQVNLHQFAKSAVAKRHLINVHCLFGLQVIDPELSLPNAQATITQGCLSASVQTDDLCEGILLWTLAQLTQLHFVVAVDAFAWLMERNGAQSYEVMGEKLLKLLQEG